MSKLALLGGTPVRKKAFPTWPIATEKEKKYLRKVINSDGWGIFRGKLTFEFGEKFAQYHGARYGPYQIVIDSTVETGISAAAETYSVQWI